MWGWTCRKSEAAELRWKSSWWMGWCPWRWKSSQTLSTQIEYPPCSREPPVESILTSVKDTEKLQWLESKDMDINIWFSHLRLEICPCEKICIYACQDLPKIKTRSCTPMLVYNYARSYIYCPIILLQSFPLAFSRMKRIMTNFDGQDRYYKICTCSTSTAMHARHAIMKLFKRVQNEEAYTIPYPEQLQAYFRAMHQNKH